MTPEQIENLHKIKEIFKIIDNNIDYIHQKMVLVPEKMDLDDIKRFLEHGCRYEDEMDVVWAMLGFADAIDTPVSEINKRRIELKKLHKRK
jgi:hypothetical protein